MKDTLSCIQCPDCGSVVPYSFVVIAHDGEQTAFMLVASCKRCRERGDNRSVRSFQGIDQEAFDFAVSHKLPVLLLKGA